MMQVVLFGMPGGGEMIIILFVFLMLFGAKKIPELARGLGKGIREFKDASAGIQREINQSIHAVEEKAKEATADKETEKKA